MTRFLLWVAKAALVIFIAFVALSWVGYRRPGLFVGLGYPKVWLNVVERIRAAEKDQVADTLFIGDSVSGQLMPLDHRHVLTSNGSVYAIGQYLLTKRAIAHFKGLKVVLFMSVPNVIGHKFERRNTLDNFVKPFLSDEDLEWADSTLTDKLDSTPSLYWYVLPPMKFLPISERNLENGVYKRPDELSEWAIHWLVELKRLCASNSVRLILASPPVGTAAMEKYNGWAHIREQVAGTELEGLFEPYFRSIATYPDDELEDAVHWKQDFVERKRPEMIARMLAPFK